MGRGACAAPQLCAGPEAAAALAAGPEQKVPHGLLRGGLSVRGAAAGEVDGEGGPGSAPWRRSSSSCSSHRASSALLATAAGVAVVSGGRGSAHGSPSLPDPLGCWPFSSRRRFCSPARVRGLPPATAQGSARQRAARSHQYPQRVQKSAWRSGVCR